MVLLPPPDGDSPPSRTCERLYKCFFHEFAELYYRLQGGMVQFGASGPAHDMAKREESQHTIPDSCCGRPCKWHPNVLPPDPLLP